MKATLAATRSRIPVLRAARHARIPVAKPRSLPPRIKIHLVRMVDRPASTVRNGIGAVPTSMKQLGISNNLIIEAPGVDLSPYNKILVGAVLDVRLPPKLSSIHKSTLRR